MFIISQVNGEITQKVYKAVKFYDEEYKFHDSKIDMELKELFGLQLLLLLLVSLLSFLKYFITSIVHLMTS